MEFKKLDIKPEGNWIQRLIGSQHFKKTIIAILAGAFLGFIFTYFLEGKELSQISSNDFFTNIFTGAFFGFFLTNSPCARGKC